MNLRNSYNLRWIAGLIVALTVGACISKEKAKPSQVSNKPSASEVRISKAPIGNSVGSPVGSPVNSPVGRMITDPVANHGALQEWCKELRGAVVQLKWKMDPCRSGVPWQVGGKSVHGRPLVFADFGDPGAQNTTLIFSTVHGDEVTPLYLAVQLAQWMQQHQGQFMKTRVVIAPLVNPDGFFKHPRTRMNAHGVDLNRNFTTQDWYKRALASWKVRYRSDPRRFPGNHPSSEPETHFQEYLIQRVRPQKILSIHSPLNFLDYDGPSMLSLSRFSYEYAKVCEQLKKRLRAISSGYFPGSLGNYAGRELGIPTLTLELPSADPAQAERYWHQFSQGIQTMIQFSVPNLASGNLIHQKPGG